MGPNDIRRVVWAIGMCFSFYFTCFLVINMYFDYIDVVKARGGLRWAMTTKQAQRHIQTRRLGPRYVFLYIISLLLLLLLTCI